MRMAVATLVALLLAGSGVPALFRIADAASCGRSDYPDWNDFADDSVVDRALWNEFVAWGGFANGTEAQVRVSQFVVGPTRNYTVTLNETVIIEFIGGVATNRTTIDLAVRVEERDGRVSNIAFRAVSFAGRGGANLTLAARSEGDLLIVFWRWAYLLCDETFPNSYYIFRATLAAGEVPGDNELVYFEAPRPRRGPPVDLVLLIVAGLAVSVIFLLARNALRRRA